MADMFRVKCAALSEQVMYGYKRMFEKRAGYLNGRGAGRTLEKRIRSCF